MDAAKILAIAGLVLAGTIANSAHAQGYSALTVDIHYYGGDESIPAGYPGRFRVSISNGGPDVSTNTKVWISWFSSSLTGTTSQAYTARPNQGMCSPVYTPDPDCYLQVINVGSAATIEVDGHTQPGKLTWYTLRVWVESDQAARTMLAEYSKGSSVTIAESGGGSIGWLFLLGLVGTGLVRRISADVRRILDRQTGLNG